MISNAILQAVWGVAYPLVMRIPSVQINYDGIANSTVYQFLQAGMYFLPIGTVTAILTIVVALWVLRIVIAVLHSLWAALPIV